MASFTEMFTSVLLLIVNTIVLMVVTMCAGSIIDWLAIWQAGQTAGYISAAPTQGLFGLFYGMVLAIEIGLFLNLIVTSIRRTDYTTEDGF